MLKLSPLFLIFPCVLKFSKRTWSPYTCPFSAQVSDTVNVTCVCVSTLSMSMANREPPIYDWTRISIYYYYVLNIYTLDGN